MIPYSGPKLSDLYTQSQSKLLENHTLSLYSGTHLYTPYMAELSPAGSSTKAFYNTLKSTPSSLLFFQTRFLMEQKSGGCQSVLVISLSALTYESIKYVSIHWQCFITTAQHIKKFLPVLKCIIH